MKVRESARDAYEEGKRANDDPYGAAIYEFLEAWADDVEAEVAKGAKLEDVALECSKRHSEELSGCQYGIAVSILAVAWEHGEALRVWHNLRTQLNREGERANAFGGVLNPALLEVREPEAPN